MQYRNGRPIEGAMMRELKHAQLGHFFSTPLLEHVWADSAELNEQLRESILDHAKQSPSQRLTNAGGWHSEVGRLEFCGNAGERLVSRMREMTREATMRLYAEFSATPPEPLAWVLSAWANVNQKGDSNNMHTHPGATWSAVYYVDHRQLSSSAEETALHLSDPCPTRTNIFS